MITCSKININNIGTDSSGQWSQTCGPRTLSMWPTMNIYFFKNIVLILFILDLVFKKVIK